MKHCDLTRVLLTAFCVIGAAASTAWARENNAAPSEAINKDQVDRLIADLGSTDFDVREAADRELRVIGMPAIEPLARSYRQTDDFETRVRIQRIAEHIFFWDRVLGKNGFLGISHRVFPEAPHGDPRIPEGKAAFEVVQVIRGTAAEQFGLQAGDVIISLDGTSLPDGAGPSDFANLIRFRQPGTMLVVELWRAAQHLTLNVTIGHRPWRHYGSAAPAELNEQRDAAIREFPNWWASHFGAPLLPSEFDERAAQRPLFLELPSDFGRR